MLHAHTIIENFDKIVNRFASTYRREDLSNIQTRGIGLSKTCVSLLKSAAKFDLGTFEAKDFRALAVTGIESLNERCGALPFHRTYFEVRVKGKHYEYSMGVLVLPGDVIASDYDKNAAEQYILYCFDDFYQSAPNEKWSLRDYCVVVSEDFTQCVGLSIYDDLYNDPVDRGSEGFEFFTHVPVQIVGCAIALLNNPSAEFVPAAVSEKLNKRRIRKKKPPLFEHHVLRIKGVSATGGIVRHGGTHASPRKHWRRGHVRVYQRDTVDERKILIPAVLVNGRGFVSKDYRVSV